MIGERSIDERPAEAPLPELELKAVPGTTKCPFCHESISREAERACACRSCLARHHESCWRESGRCSSCGSSEALVPKRESRAPSALTLFAGFTVLLALWSVIVIKLNDRALRSMEFRATEAMERAKAAEARASAAEAEARRALEAAPAVVPVWATTDKLEQEIAELKRRLRDPEPPHSLNVEVERARDLWRLENFIEKLAKKPIERPSLKPIGDPSGSRWASRPGEPIPETAESEIARRLRTLHDLDGTLLGPTLLETQVENCRALLELLAAGSTDEAFVRRARSAVQALKSPGGAGLALEILVGAGEIK